MRNILIILFLSVIQISFSQSKRVADRYFSEFAYPKAARLYEAVYKKGDSSQYIINRIADSYYNNSETEKAEFWYKKLVTKFDSISKGSLFRYAQSLRSNGNYVKSDSILIIFNKDRISEIKEKINFLLDPKKKDRISIRNLAINTPYSDFGAVFYNDEVYYASASPTSTKKQRLYRWNNQPFLNIYKSLSSIEPLDVIDNRQEKDSVLILEGKKIISAPLNTKYHESNPVFTKDGKTMYFTRVNSIDGKRTRKDKKQIINLKLYKATLVGTKWMNIVELPFNSDEYSVGHAALSPDEKTLYFISDMPGGYGKTDLYNVSISEEGKYGSPKNLGKTINTQGREMFPYIGADNTLYFSSNGHLGIGLLDVFQSRIKNDTTFTLPKNLGAPFNSKRDDFAFLIDEKGKKGFFSSNRKQGKGDDDIYSFMIFKQPKPKPVPCSQSIVGVVMDSKQNVAIKGATIKLIDNLGRVFQKVTSKKDGSYKFINVSCKSLFTIRGSKKNYKSDVVTVTTRTKLRETIKANLGLKPMIIGNQIVINPIYFDFNKSNIREDAQYELEDIVTVMNNNPEMVIKIESHTDCRGRASYNRSLSDRRAKSTRDYLYYRGIARNRIQSAIGYGEDKLLHNCNNNCKKCKEEEHQANRRSLFIIVNRRDDVKVNSKSSTVINRK